MSWLSEKIRRWEESIDRAAGCGRGCRMTEGWQALANDPSVLANPMVFARELAVELERDRLIRQLIADRHGISLDRVIQWLALLKLSLAQLEEVAALGDHWDRPVLTERGMRRDRRS